ncbi:MAG: putative outer membrane protein [Phormidium sp. OSCR]|nr:MAG: putative outer membrane protein [Phormidium sp. OSCR]
MIGEPQPDIRDGDESGIWLSIGDLMSGLLLFFALLFVTVMVKLRDYQQAFEQLPIVVLNAMERELGGQDIEVDERTGDVSIGDRILFDYNSATLKPEGQAFLQQFIPTYSQVIFSNPDLEHEIVRIIIEGHTSASGTAAGNLNLSLQRSQAVFNYIASDAVQFPHKEAFQQKLLPAGRGSLDANPERDDPGDRRVVFRFQLRYSKSWSE